jgi:type IX secretion system PorP/SprF family membrane protein
VFNAKSQQSPQFTQFMVNNLVINPAYAGAEEALSLTVLNRNQWSGMENAPTTQSFSAHTLVRKKNIGLGITIIRDIIGVHENLSASTNYAYHIRVRKQSIFSMGLQGSLSSIKSDYASLSGLSNDPKLANSVNETTFNFGAGIYFRNKKLHLGLSATELMSPKVYINDTLSINILSANLLAYSRYRFTLNKTLEMEPSLLIKYFPNLPVSFDINLSLIYMKVLTGGISYRRNESIDLILKFQVTPQLQFGYAYDYPIRYAAKFSNGSHELMINYLFKYIKKGVVSPR